MPSVLSKIPVPTIVLGALVAVALWLLYRKTSRLDNTLSAVEDYLAEDDSPELEPDDDHSGAYTDVAGLDQGSAARSETHLGARPPAIGRRQSLPTPTNSPEVRGRASGRAPIVGDPLKAPPRVGDPGGAIAGLVKDTGAGLGMYDSDSESMEP
jgi:hypothetical protein